MTLPIHTPESPLVASLCVLPDASTLNELFRSRTARHVTPLIHGELFTVGLFDDLAKLPASHAFALVDAAADMAIAESAPNPFACALSMLATLVRASTTTEIPRSLSAQWDDIEARMADADDYATETWADIVTWYRGGPVS